MRNLTERCRSCGEVFHLSDPDESAMWYRHRCEGQTRLVLYPCPKHLPRGSGYVMGDALGDMFWEHPNGSREQIASCRMCRDEQPPVVPASPFAVRKVRHRHYPAHRKPKG